MEPNSSAPTLIWYHHHTKCSSYLFLRVETFHPHPTALLLAQQPENQSVWWWREIGRSWLVSYAQKTNNIYIECIEWSHILPQLLPGIQCDCPGFSSLRIKVQAQHLQCGIAHLIHCKSNLFCGYIFGKRQTWAFYKLEIYNARSLSLFTWYAWMATRSSTSESPSPRLDLRIWQRWKIESHSDFLHMWRAHDHSLLSSFVKQHKTHQPDCARKIRPPDAPTVAPTACSSSSNTSTWKKLLIFIPF